ncbi:MAG TPA: hypothetical protein VFW11_23395, partial [Cyclobacteriaceae bacterium]|nr:hypothetical protein [Cyclobacteriaceae bacterium]
DYGNWQVGMVQLMKDYWLNIWWGDETDSVHCGGGFPDVMVRDVKDERSSSAWFNGTGSGPFAFDGDKKTISIVDSPGALSVPYHHFNQKTDANFGHFNFGCTFFTYISAFNYANPQSPDAWKHIKSVYWQTMLAGQFDQRLPSDQRLKVTDGGLTEIGEVMKGHPKTFPPRLDGKTGHDITCPILKCWSPKQKCRQIIE